MRRFRSFGTPSSTWGDLDTWCTTHKPHHLSASIIALFNSSILHSWVKYRKIMLGIQMGEKDSRGDSTFTCDEITGVLVVNSPGIGIRETVRGKRSGDEHGRQSTISNITGNSEKPPRTEGISPKSRRDERRSDPVHRVGGKTTNRLVILFV